MELHKKIFADGALSKKMKRGIIGLACAHATKCPYCIRGTVKDAHTDGVTAEQMAEAINVAMVMTAGSCYAHTSIAMDTLKSLEKYSFNGFFENPPRFALNVSRETFRVFLAFFL